MMILYLSVLSAFACVAGMLAYLGYCAGRLDAEAKKVESFRAAR